MTDMELTEDGYRIRELRMNYLESEKTDTAKSEWVSAVEELITEKDRLINTWNHENLHELKALMVEARYWTFYAKQWDLPFASVFVDGDNPLPSETIPEELRGVVLVIDKHGNWLMNDDQQTIKYAPDHL